MSLLNWPAPRQPRHDMVSSEERLAAYSHYQAVREFCSVPARTCRRGYKGGPARASVLLIATGEHCDGETFGACPHHYGVIVERHGFVQCDHGDVRVRARIDL